MNPTLEPTFTPPDPQSAPIVQALELTPASRSNANPLRPETCVGAEPPEVRILLLLEDIKRQIELQPGQLRKLQRGVEEVSLGLGETRYKSLLERLIAHLDFVERAEREFDKVVESRSSDLAKRLFANLNAELLQLLELNDVRRSQDSAGDLFDPQKHACVDTLNTQQSEKDGLIAIVQKYGYTFGPRCLRHSQVVVFKYQAAPPTPSDDQESDILIESGEAFVEPSAHMESGRK